MIIKSIHVGETDLKHIGTLIRLSEQKQFMKSLRLELEYVELGRNIITLEI